jgi:hypothetical protein
VPPKAALDDNPDGQLAHRTVCSESGEARNELILLMPDVQPEGRGHAIPTSMVVMA